MTKNELLNYTNEEILNIVKGKQFLKKFINNEYIFSIMIKNYSDQQLSAVITENLNILNDKNENGIPYCEILADAGKVHILEKYVSNTNILQKTYDGKYNMFGYYIKRGLQGLLDKVLEKNPSVLNEKDPSGCIGTERLVDAGYTHILEKYAMHIDLLKNDYNGQKNMLGYIAKRGMNNVLNKALEKNPDVLNNKDPSGCVGTERLVDEGLTSILEKYASYINILKNNYSGDKNMLGYLAHQGMNNVLDKVLEKNPGALNEKDPSGCVGTERLVDSGSKKILEKYASYINLLKNDYHGQKNMLGYLAKNGFSNVIVNALNANINVNALNEKDPSGCVGTERLVDTGNANVLEIHVNKIDLLKMSYHGDKNMLGYLVSKSMSDIVLKSLTINASALNKKDGSNCSGVERLIDSGCISIINTFADKIEWNKKATNEETIFQYVIKKSKNSSSKIMMKALIKNPEILKKEMKFIIDNNLTKFIGYKEILSNIDRNMNIEDMNLLGYLSYKKQEYFVDLLLNQEKASYYIKEQKIEEKPIENIKFNKEDIKINKEIVIEKKEKIQNKEAIVTIKQKIKAML